MKLRHLAALFLLSTLIIYPAWGAPGSASALDEPANRNSNEFLGWTLDQLSDGFELLLETASSAADAFDSAMDAWRGEAPGADALQDSLDPETGEPVTPPYQDPTQEIGPGMVPIG